MVFWSRSGAGPPVHFENVEPAATQSLSATAKSLRRSTASVKCEEQREGGTKWQASVREFLELTWWSGEEDGGDRTKLPSRGLSGSGCAWRSRWVCDAKACYPERLWGADAWALAVSIGDARWVLTARQGMGARCSVPATGGGTTDPIAGRQRIQQANRGWTIRVFACIDSIDHAFVRIIHTV